MSHTMRREGRAAKEVRCNVPDFDDELLQLINEALKESSAKDEQQRQEWRADIETKDKP